jgi:hypothetical protein
MIRDEILVEEKFTHSWEGGNSSMLKAKHLEAVRAWAFLPEPRKIAI